MSKFVVSNQTAAVWRTAGVVLAARVKTLQWISAWLTEEKTKTIKEYKERIKWARQDTARLDACERLLKVVEPAAAGS